MKQKPHLIPHRLLGLLLILITPFIEANPSQLKEPLNTKSNQKTHPRTATVLSLKKTLPPSTFLSFKHIIERIPLLGPGHSDLPREKLEKECHAMPHIKALSPLTPPCTQPYMSPLSSKVCIDQFAFPNLPCAFPWVWARPIEAQSICQSLGKRLCFANEWEASCAAQPIQPFAPLDASLPIFKRHASQRQKHNTTRPLVWSYQKPYTPSLCSMRSQKGPLCDQALASGKDITQHCQTNTYPTGHFEHCKSSLGVYDLHGNVAEIMGLPLFANATIESSYSELKGSWFIFQSYKPHEDDCYWRAPSWHMTKISDPKGHHNYHLGFRCCQDLK